MNDIIEDLVALAKRGDRHAFSEIVMLTQQKVFQYCYPMMANRQDAEDAVQETFIRAYENLGLYKETGRFTGWLFTIAHRACLNKLKKRSRFHALMRKLASEKTAADSADRMESPNAEVLSMLDSLNPKVRAVVILKVLHGMSYEEISSIVGVHSANLRKQFERARKQLQNENENDDSAKIKRGVKYEY